MWTVFKDSLQQNFRQSLKTVLKTALTLAPLRTVLKTVFHDSHHFSRIGAVWWQSLITKFDHNFWWQHFSRKNREKVALFLFRLKVVWYVRLPVYVCWLNWALSVISTLWLLKSKPAGNYAKDLETFRESPTKISKESRKGVRNPFGSRHNLPMIHDFYLAKGIFYQFTIIVP